MSRVVDEQAQSDAALLVAFLTDRDLPCPRCGYNLRGLTGDVCPECGNALAAMRLAVPQIPWLRRRNMGRFIAYWETVLFVMFRQRELCYEMARDVSYTDAQRFRLVTLLHAVAPVVVLALFAYQIAPPSHISSSSGFLRSFPPCPSITHWAYAAGWPIAMFIGSLALALAMATGVATYFAQPRGMPVHLQSRAIALSYYTAAPLAWTFLPVMVGMVGWSFLRRHEMIASGLLMLAFLLMILELGVWWSDSVRLLCRTIPRHKHRVWLAGVGLPVLWATAVGAVFGLTTLVAIFIALVVESLKL